VIVVNDFLNDFDIFRNHAISRNYDATTNPQDGIAYPDISLDIPEEIKAEITAKIAQKLGGNVVYHYLFMRKSSQGVSVPNIVHSDHEMGQFSLMLYLNDLDDCLGGTAFMSHKDTGMNTHPINQKQLDILHADGNDIDKWQAQSVVQMMPNRAVLFDSKDLHCALPVGGFGSTNQDSRLVLTAFFECHD
tara:strand:+ start:330 stop:899 length:570 start_codon:yes stop_codon:yes gene_type:complete